MSGQATLPLDTKLAVLQQAEYEWSKLQEWLEHQPPETRVEPKAWTTKLQLLRTLTKVSTPLLSENGSLWLWNDLLAIPQSLLFAFVILLASAKLRILQMRGLQVVSIAGSYAKTSTKHITDHLISGEKLTLVSPGNINTLFGIARLIMQQLTSKHEVLVVELGEYNPGDIAKFASLLHPSIVVLTPVGISHLERFHTKEAIEKEFLMHLQCNPKARALVSEKNQKLLAQYNVHLASLAYYGEQDIGQCSVSRAGTEFNMTMQGSQQHVFIPLLGEHNAVNVVAAVRIGTMLGINEKSLASRLSTLPQVQYRFETQVMEGNILIINNGYNSNPDSAQEALSVLQKLEGSQKVVITPGFVELGTEQAKANQQFATAVAQIADIAVIVKGANEDALAKGFAEARFPKHALFLASTEMEAMELIRPHIQPNAVILFENSLLEVYK